MTCPSPNPIQARTTPDTEAEGTPNTEQTNPSPWKWIR